jgi:hypothetical protein
MTVSTKAKISTICHFVFAFAFASFLPIGLAHLTASSTDFNGNCG